MTGKLRVTLNMWWKNVTPDTEARWEASEAHNNFENAQSQETSEKSQSKRQKYGLLGLKTKNWTILTRLVDHISLVRGY